VLLKHVILYYESGVLVKHIIHRYRLWIYLRSEIRGGFAEDEEKKGVECAGGDDNLRSEEGPTL
jgi:hypothetical protein